MKINYKKIASVFASAVMLTSTVGFAAAANYPAPFSTSGGAVVYGAAGLKSDVIAAIKVAASVKVVGGKSTGPVTGSDSVALFTGSTKIVPSDVLNKVKGVVMKSDLPNVLAKGTFSVKGNGLSVDSPCSTDSVSSLYFGNLASLKAATAPIELASIAFPSSFIQ